MDLYKAVISFVNFVHRINISKKITCLIPKDHFDCLIQSPLNFTSFRYSINIVKLRYAECLQEHANLWFSKDLLYFFNIVRLF